MEAITDFFKEIKSRLSNPLLGSFAISWLVINWKIPVGLIGYKQIDLKVDGYKSYIDLINVNASCWLYFWKPFIWAVIYTFGFPLLKMCITAFLNEIKRRSDNWNTRILRTYYVPMSRFVKQRELYNELSDNLQKIYTEERTIVDENVRLKSDIITITNEMSKYKNELSEIIKRMDDLQIEEKFTKEENIGLKNNIEKLHYQQGHQHDIQLLNGKWGLDLIKESLGRSITIEINNSNIIHSERGTPLGTIELASFDFVNQKVFMVVKMLDLYLYMDTIRTGIYHNNDLKLRILTLSIRTVFVEDRLAITLMRGKSDMVTYEFRAL